MTGRFKSFLFLFATVAFVLTLNLASYAEASRALITQKIDETRTVTLAGNTRPEANVTYDRGAVAPDFDMGDMQILLQRSPDQEKVVDQFVRQLNDPKSPNYHQYLTNQQVGALFGTAQSDIGTVTHWLETHGLKVNFVYPNGMLIDFTGTAAQVEQAFQVEIHKLVVNGEQHYGNMDDPRIPAALAPVVNGVIGLHNFEPKPNYTCLTCGDRHGFIPAKYVVLPADFATIYNLNPLFKAGITGLGETVVVIEDSDVYNLADWSLFRQLTGLARYTHGNVSQIHPGSNCRDPGVGGAEDEAALDAQWSSAAAPNASIVLAACSSLLTAINNVLATNPKNTVMSISYGSSEATNGAASNAAYNTAFQTASLQGVAVFVSSGDEGADSTDANATHATHGISISGLTSSVYDVSVGGTDFGDTYAGTNTTYWNNYNNVWFESAKSYIPEIPWNDSCASTLLANYAGFSAIYGASSYCNYLFANNPSYYYVTVVSGSGGPSGCATGSPATRGVVGGTCAGWPKPDFQANNLGKLAGLQNDNVRDIPDVSLFAANGVWGHYYAYCDSDPADLGGDLGGGPITACTGPAQTWPGGGGTSFSSPIMAGIQALVNQHTATTWGRPNEQYYELAASEYGPGGNGACNSTLGNAVSNSCVFYDVTQGDIYIPCTALSGNTYYDCYSPSGHYGILSTSNNSPQPAYNTTIGWDFPTGIGTVNAYNLVMNWPSQ
ncbi:MAG: protease pro-enzyme activation domain-containing protein [Candidatus Korobacteraceae bacterium]